MVLVCVGDSGDGNSESRSVLSGFTCFCQDKCQPIVVASMVARVGPLAKADPAGIEHQLMLSTLNIPGAVKHLSNEKIPEVQGI